LAGLPFGRARRVCSCQALDCNNQEVDAAEKNHAVHFPPSAATPAVAEVMSPILTEHLPDDAEDGVSKILVPEKFWYQKSSGARKALVSAKFWCQQNPSTRKVLVPEKLWCKQSSGVNAWVSDHYGIAIGIRVA
jgi:hypothetical protein